MYKKLFYILKKAILFTLFCFVNLSVCNAQNQDGLNSIICTALTSSLDSLEQNSMRQWIRQSYNSGWCGDTVIYISTDNYPPHFQCHEPGRYVNFRIAKNHYLLLNADNTVKKNRIPHRSLKQGMNVLYLASIDLKHDTLEIFYSLIENSIKRLSPTSKKVLHFEVGGAYFIFDFVYSEEQKDWILVKSRTTGI